MSAIQAEIYEALHSATLLRTKSEPPFGDYRLGRQLEEYQLADGKYLQVAWDNRAKGSWKASYLSPEPPAWCQIDNWHVSEERMPWWV